MRDLVIHDDVHISTNTYMKFLNFMQRCKGYEEDAKKFLMLVPKSSSYLQIDYNMCQPFVTKTLKHQGGSETIKLFEQLRKNIALNKAWKDKPLGEKNQELRRIRKEFFDGLIEDLISAKQYQYAEIVMAEKVKEKFDVTTNDELIGINVYSAQKKMTEYMEKFNLLFETNQVSIDVCSKLSNTLLAFDEDKYKNDRLMMAERL